MQKDDFQTKLQHIAFGEKEREAGCAVLKLPLKIAKTARQMQVCKYMPMRDETVHVSY